MLMIADTVPVCTVPIGASTELPDHKAECRDELQKAEILIANGSIQEARERLLALEKAMPGESQVQFLLGLISLGQKDYADAIVRFRRIVASEPNAVRVRLELGRAYFQKGDLRNAERQFQFARSGNLPPAVIKNVDAYLANIRRNRTFETGLSIAIAPDTNINRGPSTSNVLLYGLPFQLSPDAKASSGVGLAVGGRMTWTPRLSNEWRWDVGVAADARRYGEQAFNDTAIAAFTGPHLILDRIEARLNARASKRWYSGTAYADGVGGNFDITYYLSGRTGVFANVGITRLDYPQIPSQSGVVSEYALGAFHALTSSSIGRASFTVGRQGARAPALANKILGGDANYLREFGGGFTANLLSRYRDIRYDARLPAFQSARKDRQLVTQITLLNRRIVIEGFTPTLAYTHTLNDSNLPLFRYRRSQFEFGLSRVF
jgi:tetratricopeptide (TPR) repeat protein